MVGWNRIYLRQLGRLEHLEVLKEVLKTVNIIEMGFPYLLTDNLKSRDASVSKIFATFGVWVWV